MEPNFVRRDGSRSHATRSSTRHVSCERAHRNRTELQRASAATAAWRGWRQAWPGLGLSCVHSVTERRDGIRHLGWLWSSLGRDSLLGYSSGDPDRRDLLADTKLLH